MLLEGAATLNLKLLSDKYCFTPFLTAGIGGSKYIGYYSAFMPFGVGAQVRLIDEVYLLLNSQYRVPITENGSYHFYHSVGFAANLTKKKEPAPVVVPPPPPVVLDRDGDGIPDADDKCPDVRFLLATVLGNMLGYKNALSAVVRYSCPATAVLCLWPR